MSTGAECAFTKKATGWWYEIQKHPYGATEDYHHHGPFLTFEDAERHLRRNYANPGGYSVDGDPET